MCDAEPEHGIIRHDRFGIDDLGRNPEPFHLQAAERLGHQTVRHIRYDEFYFHFPSFTSSLCCFTTGIVRL